MSPDLPGRHVGAGHDTDTLAAGVAAPVDTSAAVAEPSETSSGESDEPPSSPTVLTEDERSDTAVPVDLSGLAALLSAVLQREGIPAHAEASLTLVDPDTIAQLKVEYLDGDGAATDVLSFPIDGADADVDNGAEGDLAPGSWMVGDIVVCPQVARDQAPDHAGTLEDELALLVVHGALHLVGWDHEDGAERRAMWSRERTLLEELHREPARDPWSEADYPT